MTTYDILLEHNFERDLDSFAKEFFSVAGVVSYVERESIHCAEERYFLGEREDASFKVMRSEDEAHADLPFWVSIKSADLADRNFDIDQFVRAVLIPRGFRVARLTNFGWADEIRFDY